MIYKFPSVSLSDGELAQQDSTSVLRIAPLLGGSGIIVAFVHSDVRFRAGEDSTLEPIYYDRTIVVATDESLSYAASRVLLGIPGFQLLDAVPVHGINKCMLLGRDPRGGRYWLRSADRETGVTGPAYFLDNWMPTTPGNDQQSPLFRRRTYGPPTYTPICCGGRLGGGNDFLVVAKRTREIAEAGADDLEYALVGLIVSADTLTIQNELVLGRNDFMIDGPATVPSGRPPIDFSTRTVKCWPVTTGPNGTWDVGINMGGGNVTIFEVSSTWVGIQQGVAATSGYTLKDFRLAGGHVDLGHLQVYSRIYPTPVRVGCIVLLEREINTGELQMTAVDYLDRTRRFTVTETGETYWLPTPVLLGPTGGPIRLAHDPGAGSNWGFLHRATGASGLRDEFCRIGSSKAVFERLSFESGTIAISAAGGHQLLGDLAITYEPSKDGMLVGQGFHHGGPDSAAGVSLRRVHRRPLMMAIPNALHQDCPEIGQKCIREPLRPPTIGCVPFAGQRWFEVHLRGAPSHTQVRLVISPEISRERGLKCSPRVIRTPGKSFSRKMMTDDDGNAVCTLRFDDIDMPEIFRADTSAYATSGNILDYPCILFAQWSWTSNPVDLDVFIDGLWNDLINQETGETIRPEMSHMSISYRSDLMTLLLGC